MMSDELNSVKSGLALVLAGLIFGISMGVLFATNEDTFKEAIAQGITAHPEVHDTKSQDKIWRYAQRSHFHATGIGAFSIGLILLILVSDMKAGMKQVSSILIGLGSLYPLAWFNMYLMAPSIGRDAAHHHIATEASTYIGVGGLSLGILLLCGNLFAGLFKS